MKRIRSRRRKIVFALITLTFSSIIVLALMEAAARWLAPAKTEAIMALPEGYIVNDPVTGYELAKDYPMTRYGREWAGDQNYGLYYTNSYGMHDVEPPARREGQLRILAVGCSMTEGVLHHDKMDPWPRQFEDHLQEALPQASPVVMNSGVIGYNTFQQVARARKMHEAGVEADIWLMAYMGSDIGMWGRNTFGEQGQFVYKWRAQWDVNSLAALENQRSGLFLWLMDKSMLMRWLGIRLTDFAKGAERDLREYTDFETATREALKRFSEAAQAADARPIVVMIHPVFQLQHICEGEPHAVYDDHAAAIARELGMTVLSFDEAMVEAFRERYDDCEIVRRWQASENDVAHYNAEANAVFGELLAERLAPQLEEHLEEAGVH